MNVAQVKDINFLNDNDLINYIKKAQKLSMINFETEEQQNNLMNDFKAALLFVKKMDYLQNEKVSNLLPEN